MGSTRWRLGHRPALDGLRGLAVLIVVADHAGFLREPAGGIGVTVFFVLSGFLITRVVVEARDAGRWRMSRFLASRLVRLFPALLVTVVVTSAVLLVEGRSLGWVGSRAVPALGYVQNMAPRRSFPVFGHTWSLGVEEQFYLLWPFALPLVARSRRALAVLTACILVSAGLMVALERDWLPMHAYALLAGCALALGGRVRSRPWLVPVGAVWVATAVAVAPYLHPVYVYGPMLATPGAVLLVAGAAMGSTLLESPALRFVGRVSYAWYLWHVPTLRLTGTTYAGAPALLPVAAAFLVAVVSTLLLEEPLRGRWRERHADPVPVTAPVSGFAADPGVLSRPRG